MYCTTVPEVVVLGVSLDQSDSLIVGKRDRYRVTHARNGTNEPSEHGLRTIILICVAHL